MVLSAGTPPANQGGAPAIIPPAPSNVPPGRPLMQPMNQPLIQPLVQPMVQPLSQPLIQPMAQPLIQPVSQQPLIQPMGLSNVPLNLTGNVGGAPMNQPSITNITSPVGLLTSPLTNNISGFPTTNTSFDGSKPNTPDSIKTVRAASISSQQSP